MNSQLNLWLAQARDQELRRAACGHAPADSTPVPEPGSAVPAVTLRYAFPDDVPAVARLAVLDSSDPPAMPVLLAEVEGAAWAALSLADGRVVADPFRPTAAVVELLQARARQLQGVGRRRDWWRGFRRRQLRAATPAG